MRFAYFFYLWSTRLSDILHFCLVLASASLWVGGKGASTSISYMVFISGLPYDHFFNFSFIRCSTTTWIFSFTDFSSVSDLDSIDESTFDGSFNVSLRASCLG